MSGVAFCTPGAPALHARAAAPAPMALKCMHTTLRCRATPTAASSPPTSASNSQRCMLGRSCPLLTPRTQMTCRAEPDAATSGTCPSNVKSPRIWQPTASFTPFSRHRHVACANLTHGYMHSSRAANSKGIAAVPSFESFFGPLHHCNHRWSSMEVPVNVRGPIRSWLWARAFGIRIPSRAQHRGRCTRVSAAAAEVEDGNSLSSAELRPVRDSTGQLTAFPTVPGVYAVYDSDNILQFIGLSRKVLLLIDHPTLPAQFMQTNGS